MLRKQMRFSEVIVETLSKLDATENQVSLYADCAGMEDTNLLFEMLARIFNLKIAQYRESNQ